jgi:hypothetical protein
VFMRVERCLSAGTWPTAGCCSGLQFEHAPHGHQLGLAAYWSSWHDEARDSPQMLQFLGLDGAKGDRWVRCLQQVTLCAF